MRPACDIRRVTQSGQCESDALGPTRKIKVDARRKPSPSFGALEAVGTLTSKRFRQPFNRIPLPFHRWASADASHAQRSAQRARRALRDELRCTVRHSNQQLEARGVRRTGTRSSISAPNHIGQNIATHHSRVRQQVTGVPPPNLPLKDAHRTQ